jgi:hypothetical protein
MDDRPVLAPKLLRDLASTHPFGAQPLDVELVAAWWDATWPTFKLFEEKQGRPFSRRGLAIRKWWAKARVADLDRAREILERREVDAAAARQRELLAAPPARAAGDHRVALRKIMGGRA